MTPREQPSWQDLLDLVTRLDGGSYDAVSVQVGDVSVTMSRGGALPPPTAPVVVVPEPSTFAMAAAGFVALLVHSRRRLVAAAAVR